MSRCCSISAMRFLALKAPHLEHTLELGREVRGVNLVIEEKHLHLPLAVLKDSTCLYALAT